MELLISLLIACLVIGVLWWAISQIPMPQPIRTVVTVVFALIVVLVLLSYVGFPLHSRL